MTERKGVKISRKSKPAPSRMFASEPVLVTGATGYIGGRLVAALEKRGVDMRAMARSLENLRPRVEHSTDVIYGDALDVNSLKHALTGVKTAYYLIHSMGDANAFQKLDRAAAENFADASQARGVERIIYLGGLIPESGDLSPHLASRKEVGEILRSSGVPVLEFRASVVIGSGSLSFELVRALVERLPIMITPRWVSVPAQPIGIEDLIQYLTEALDLPLDRYGIFEIGGADQVSYADIMRVYARCRGLRRVMIPVPFLTPYLSSLWLGLVTPVYARIGRKLIESIVHPTVVQDNTARQVFSIDPVGIEVAVRGALENEDREFAATRWSDPLSSTGGQQEWQHKEYGARLIDSRRVKVDVPPAAAFRPIQRLGGRTGWYAFNWLWRLRGFLDLLVGGVGLRRGRSHPSLARVGDTIDFWRIEIFEPDRRLRLLAEMKLPGRAWLDFEVQPQESGAVIRQRAEFDPLGLTGRLYWYALYPIHLLVFRKMLAGIAAQAERLG